MGKKNIKNVRPSILILSIVSSGYAIINLIISLINDSKNIWSSPAFYYYIIGILAILIISINAAKNDISNLTKDNIIENKVLGVGQEASDYSFEKITKGLNEEIIIVGQNLRTLLASEKNKKRIIKLLDDGIRVTFLIAKKETLEKVYPKAAKHIDDTYDDINSIYRTTRRKELFCVYYNDNTLSMSLIYADKTSGGIIVINPKWFYDNEPLNRIYIVISEKENPVPYNKIKGYFPYMMQSDTPKHQFS
jgi:hypothetical protein